MRQIVETLRDDLTKFIVGRDDLVLVVQSSDSDAAVTSTILGSIDESSTSELFWSVVDDFVDAQSFVEACIHSFAAKHDAVRLVLEKKAEPSLPELPAEITQSGELEPVERLKQLIVFSRTLLPTLNGCAVVWGFLPMQITNVSGYVQFMTSLWQHEFPFPWCHHIRMIVRDVHPESLFGSRLNSCPRVRVTSIDLSPDSLREALEEEAGDDELPLEQRVNSTLILAGMDYSHARYDRAIQQYEVVHRYAAATNNPTLAAIALHGIGESHRLSGHSDLSGGFYEAAIGSAGQASSPPVPVLFNLYLNLGQVRHSQQRWEESEVYYKGAADFAYVLRDPEHRLHCWHKLGEAQYQQGKSDEAMHTWSDGAIVAGKLDLDDDYQAFISRLRAHYAQQDDHDGLSATMAHIETSVAAARQEGRQEQGSFAEGPSDELSG